MAHFLSSTVKVQCRVKADLEREKGFQLYFKLLKLGIADQFDEKLLTMSKADVDLFCSLGT